MAFLNAFLGFVPTQYEAGIFAGFIGLMIIMFLVGWIIGSFFLYIGLGVAGVPPEDRPFGSVMITQLIVAILQSFIPIIGCILAWYIIKVRHTDSWGGAIVAWLIALIIPLIIALGIYIAILGGSLAFAGMGP